MTNSQPRPASANATLPYRHDIDGLRAIAVAGVLAFHFFPEVLPGGFWGVDIFFVISGYLITGIITKSLPAGFSFRTFYRRRALRILPASLSAIALTLAVGALVLLPHEYRIVGDEALASTLFSANIYFWRQAGYFAAAASTRPLLHFWSLGVEEQFYVVWPLVLVAAWRVVPRVSFTLKVIAAGGVLSFLFNLVFVVEHSDAVFFLPLSRAWTFLLGAALVIVHQRRPHVAASLRHWTALAAATVGTAAMAWSMLLLNNQFDIPGYVGLVPAVGAVLVLHGGAHPIATSILGSRPLRYVGRISYSLYLVHWLVFVFLGYASPAPPSVTMRLVGGVVSVALAAVSYRWVETPARGGRGPMGSVRNISVCFVVVVLAAVAVRTGTLSSRFPADIGQVWREAADDWHVGDGFTATPAQPFELFTRRGARPGQVLYVGDSNMQHYAVRLAAVSDARWQDTYDIVFLTCRGCLPMPGVMRPRQPQCLGFWSAVERYVAEHDVRRIVLSGRWNPNLRDPIARYDDGGTLAPLHDVAVRERALAAFETALQRLTDDGVEVTFMHNVPSGDADLQHPQFAEQRFSLSANADLGPSPRRVAQEKMEDTWTRHAIDEMALHIGATTLDPLLTMCPDRDCVIVDDEGLPVFKDTAHVTARYMRAHASFIDVTALP